MIGEMGLDPLLNLSKQLEQSGGRLAGIPGDLTSIVDPALLQALGELGLSEDLGVLGALEDSTRTVLNAGEQRSRLSDRFTRQQELTGASLGERGIAVRDSRNSDGLVGETATQLGKEQGQNLGDFNAAVGEDLRNILMRLGRGQVGNVGELGNTFLGSISGSLGQALDDSESILNSQ